MNYHKIHIKAKCYICLLVLALSMVSLVAAYYNCLICVAIVNSIQVIVWMFGVNTVEYMLETVYNMKHEHRKF